MNKVTGVLSLLAILAVVGCGGGGAAPQPPSVTTQPADVTVVGGQDATFTVVATGYALSYQWQRSDDSGATWTDITGATSAGYIFSTVLADDGAQFACVVTSIAGSVTSDAAVLAVNMASPTITTQPVDVTVVEGQDATFTVVATGGALSYQWQKNGVDVTGGTGAASDTYTTPATVLVDDGVQFTCVIANTEGSVTSNAATLTVNMAPPTIATQPADVTVAEGQDATFTVVATGSGTLMYQWQKDGVDVTGGTGAQTDSYTTPAAVLADNDALFQCIVTNAGGNTSSSAATLTVIVPPTITTPPADTTTIEGSDATFTVVAAGGALTYQWQKNGVDVTGGTGATSDTYTTPAAVIATDNGAQFTCIVTNIAGSLTSDAATLTVDPFVSWKVDTGVAASGDGRAWTTAFKTLQEALDVATTGQEIWVAAGTYYPTSRSDAATARTETFRLLDGVAVYGGFDGTETLRGESDWATNVTVLSGDIGTAGDDTDNAYHVVTGVDNAIMDGFTVTAGNAYGDSPHHRGGGMYNDHSSPTVTNCTFSGNSTYWYGGGMSNSYSSPTVTNCVFSANSAWNGGGMYNLLSSSPVVTNCTFSGNSARNGGGMYNYSSSSPTLTDCLFSGNSATSGGGMYNRENSSPMVTDCSFSGNSVGVNGGAMYNDNSPPTLTNCTFSGNSAQWGGGMYNWGSSPAVTNCTFSGNSGTSGGGMFNDHSSPTLTNCTFAKNSVSYGGGGMHSREQTSPTLMNCVFFGNSARRGGGMWNLDSSPMLTNCTLSGNSATSGGGIYNERSSLPTATNCILWDNTAATSGPEVFNESSTPTFSYCDIEGSGGSGSWAASIGTDAGGNIDADPMLTSVPAFVDITRANGTNVTIVVTVATVYTIADVIEIGGDGTARTVSWASGTTVTFSPALATISIDETHVANWGSGATDLTYDLRLAGSSPCIDAGDTTALPADTADLDGDTNTTEDIPYDLDGNPRVVGSEVDMGAYEVQ